MYLSNMKHTVIAFLFLFATLTLEAQTLRRDVELRLNHPEGVYAKGDSVKLWADVKAVPSFEVSFRVMKFCNWKPETESPVQLHEGENLLWTGVFDEPVQYVFELTDGVVPKDFKKDGVNNVFAGFVVAPEEFEVGFEEPSDMMRFWKKEIRRMRRLPIDYNVSGDSTDGGLRTYHIDISCVGPKRLQAYVSHPSDAKPKSLPIILYLHYASTDNPSLASTAREYAQIVEGGALAMDLNAHGMLDDQPKEYYKALGQGELKGYSSREPLNKDDYYFKWMMLRAQRALDFLTRSPLWDRKHIIVTGTSQGGYQSAFLAGMDKRVTSAILTVPAGLDQGASLKGRRNSWPNTMAEYEESSLKNSPYFDGALWIRHTRADIWCEIGMYDFTCPAANLFATLNAVDTDKDIVLWQRPHSLYPGQTHGNLDEKRRGAFQRAAVK